MNETGFFFLFVQKRIDLIIAPSDAGKIGCVALFHWYLILLDYILCENCEHYKKFSYNILAHIQNIIQLILNISIKIGPNA